MFWECDWGEIYFTWGGGGGLMKASPVVTSEASLSGQEARKHSRQDRLAGTYLLSPIGSLTWVRFQLLSGGSSSELSPHQTKH